ncbi:MAG: YraN family protein [Solirubrobacterales bacterium]|nr:YraN family protein [Solirubrobacterales bacterium]
MASPIKPDQRPAVGRVGELAVREYVTRRGWQIVDHNVRWREGELDLLAIDGNTLVIAEVKTLVARGQGGKIGYSPFESIDRRKQNQIRMLARRWLVDDVRRRSDPRNLTFTNFRFDAFAVTVSRSHDVLSLEHLEDAF